MNTGVGCHFLLLPLLNDHKILGLKKEKPLNPSLSAGPASTALVDTCWLFPSVPATSCSVAGLVLQPDCFYLILSFIIKFLLRIQLGEGPW